MEFYFVAQQFYFQFETWLAAPCFASDEKRNGANKKDLYERNMCAECESAREREREKDQVQFDSLKQIDLEFRE